jgi:hypothetical protein
MQLDLFLILFVLFVNLIYFNIIMQVLIIVVKFNLT